MTTNNITSFFVPLSVKGFLFYRRLKKLYTAISSVIGLSNKFVDWKCFGHGWCLMDAFRLNYFIRFSQVHSNKRWHKFHVSIKKFFECLDHNMAWLYFSENHVFDGSALFKNLFPANSWEINLDPNWVPIPSLHKTTSVNDLPHSVSKISITFFRHPIDVILLWSEFSVPTTTLLFLISFVTPLK